MGISYSIVCIDCGECYHLGKTHKVKTKHHQSDSYGFSSIGNVSQNSDNNYPQFLVGLQHFLILHRQHELRVLPDNKTQVQDAWTWFDDLEGLEGGLEHLLSQSVKAPSPGHDPDFEEPIDIKVLERLESNSKAADTRFIDSWTSKK